ncbi:MAG: penicillin-binding protein 2 [Flavobacteriales bacterium]|nr:penicillin-binding protein 2 [Flavobacteriales bacterium]
MNLGNRRYIITGIFLLFGVIFIARLFSLQVATDDWRAKAAELTEEKVKIYPSRGLIYDRNGELLVANRAIYDLMATPRKVAPFDTVAFCDLIKMDVEDFEESFNKAKRYSRYKASVIKKQIDPEDFARIAEQLHKYPGFYGQTRTVRNYTRGIGAHVLGDFAEAGPKDIERNSYYMPGDYIGKGGIERTYEEELRGRKGAKYVLVDVRNNVQESFDGGRLDTAAVQGKDLTITLEADLQAYAEKLMQNKLGSVVAIEPKTGEILALVSAPGWDPNLLVGSQRGTNYAQLQGDSLKPLYTRAIQGQYRPGSIFKMVQSLIALQDGKITPATRITCNRGIIGCHGAHSYDDLEGAIMHSCNPYFHQVMKRMVEQGEEDSRFKDAQIGLNAWKEKIHRFGFGTDLNSDIPRILKGNVPGSSYYDNIYGELSWAYSTIYSISIGEGELLINPLQMANLSAIIANRGYYYPPHVIKSVGTDGKPEQFLEPVSTGVDEQHFETVVNAMQKVVDTPGGTARRARIEGIEVCGKTGTVQNDPLPDHSVFIAFAPKDDPQIAVSVYVEWSGFGGTWAAPIASLLIEQYLNDSIANPAKEQRILDAEFLGP